MGVAERRPGKGIATLCKPLRGTPDCVYCPGRGGPVWRVSVGPTLPSPGASLRCKNPGAPHDLSPSTCFACSAAARSRGGVALWPLTTAISVMFRSWPVMPGCKNRDTPGRSRLRRRPPDRELQGPGACAKRWRHGQKTPPATPFLSFFPRSAAELTCVRTPTVRRAPSARHPAQNSLDRRVQPSSFDGECEVYKSYGLRRVVTPCRYIDGKGSPGAVNVNLSRFGFRAEGRGTGFFFQPSAWWRDRRSR